MVTLHVSDPYRRTAATLMSNIVLERQCLEVTDRSKCVKSMSGLIDLARSVFSESSERHVRFDWASILLLTRLGTKADAI